MRGLLVASVAMFSMVSYGKGKGSHAHGVGELNIGIEDKRVMVEIEVPMADVVGFERKPKSKKEMVKVKKVWENIMAGQFISIEGGDCQSQIEVEGLLNPKDADHDDKHSHGKKHDDHHDHDKKHDDDDDDHHSHDKKHDDHHDHDKKHDDHHDHDKKHDDHHDHKHKEGETHQDIEINVVLNCKKSIRGKKLRLELTKVVPGVKKVQQQVIGGAKAQGGLVKVKDVMTFNL